MCGYFTKSDQDLVKHSAPLRPQMTLIQGHVELYECDGISILPHTHVTNISQIGSDQTQSPSRVSSILSAMLVIHAWSTLLKPRCTSPAAMKTPLVPTGARMAELTLLGRKLVNSVRPASAAQSFTNLCAIGQQMCCRARNTARSNRCKALDRDRGCKQPRSEPTTG